MVRAKGGRRQPRYFFLKEAGEKRLIELMGIVEGQNETEEICNKFNYSIKDINYLIETIKVRLGKK